MNPSESVNGAGNEEGQGDPKARPGREEGVPSRIGVFGCRKQQRSQEQADKGEDTSNCRPRGTLSGIRICAL